MRLMKVSMEMAIHCDRVMDPLDMVELVGELGGVALIGRISAPLATEPDEEELIEELVK